VPLVNIFRRIVFFAQWPAAVLAPIWLFIAPGAFQPGWSAVLALITGPLLFIVMIVPAIICVSARTVRRSGMAPAVYAVLVVLLWIAVLVFGLAFPGSSDVKAYPSFLEGAGASADTADAVAAVCTLAVIGLSIGIIVAASVGAAQARKSALSRPL
jgi:hypothetical protein